MIHSGTLRCGDMALKRSGPPKRKRGLRSRSEKAMDKQADREMCRQEVIARDLPSWVDYGYGTCIMHRMLRCRTGVHGRCALEEMGSAPEVHEIVTRGRGGSTLEPENCIALCHVAHRWVTAHPSGAEALGLMLPSWSGPDVIEQAAGLRADFLDPYSRRQYTIPHWVKEQLGAMRDLRELGWPT